MFVTIAGLSLLPPSCHVRCLWFWRRFTRDPILAPAPSALHPIRTCTTATGTPTPRRSHLRLFKISCPDHLASFFPKTDARPVHQVLQPRLRCLLTSTTLLRHPRSRFLSFWRRALVRMRARRSARLRCMMAGMRRKESTILG